MVKRKHKNEQILCIYRKINEVLAWIFDFITTTKEDGIENFCKTEYGTDWQWAYSHYQKNKSFPSPFKQAA